MEDEYDYEAYEDFDYGEAVDICSKRDREMLYENL